MSLYYGRMWREKRHEMDYEQLLKWKVNSRIVVLHHHYHHDKMGTLLSGLGCIEPQMC
jgi:hypothetical protein